jgi:S-adenosylhomocysteine hydrolase
MGEERKNATKTVTCQIDDLRLVAGNVICLVSAGLKIRLADCSGCNFIMDLALRNRFCAPTAAKFDLFI